MGAAFGGRGIEVGGIVVRPAFQGRRIGTLLVRDFVHRNDTKLLTAHTRNPALLRLFAEVCGGEHNVHPFNNTPELAELAMEIRGASREANAVYHLNRYGNDGLYGRGDPADRPSGEFASLKDRFPALEHPGNALVVVGQIPEGGTLQ